MIESLKGIVTGALVFLLVLTLSLTMLTATDTTSTLMRTMLPMVTGFGVLVYAIVSMFRAKGG